MGLIMTDVDDMGWMYVLMDLRLIEKRPDRAWECVSEATMLRLMRYKHGVL